jgi:hypothetical protein
MFIECDEYSLLLHSPFQNQRIVSARLAGFGRAHDVVARRTQEGREFDPKHLIEVKAHDGLSRAEGGDFCVQNGLPGVAERGLNIGPRQLRIASKQGIPRFAAGQLFQDGRHRNSCSRDDRLAATNPWIDFNAFSHPFNHTRTA